MSTRTLSRTGTGILVAAVLALGVAACTAGGAAPASSVAPPTDPAAPVADSPTPSASVTPVPDITQKPGASRVPGLPGSPAPVDGEGVPPAVIQAAVDDAAARAGVDPAEVTVLSTEPVTWPNGALGCPKPGSMYTQALTPGYRVVVEAGGVRYDYRSSQQGDVSWCENPPGPG